jgi:hypothetical protein
MAILEAPKQFSRIKLEGLAIKGTFIATCIDVEDRFGVQRKKYESEDMETVNLTRFYFGYKGKDGTPHIVATKPLKLSAHEKSELVKLITAWTTDKPGPGFDTQKMLGKGAQITVAHVEGGRGNGQRFANILSVGPVMDGMEASILPAASFAGLLEPQEGAEPVKVAAGKQDEDKIPF